MAWDELLHGKMLKEFRDSFVNYARAKLKKDGFPQELIADYFLSEEYKRLNQQSEGLGPAYVGLSIQKLLSCGKIDFRNGIYHEGSGRVDGSLCEELTPHEQRELVGILESGIEVYPHDATGWGENQGLTGS